MKRSKLIPALFFVGLVGATLTVAMSREPAAASSSQPVAQANVAAPGPFTGAFLRHPSALVANPALLNFRPGSDAAPQIPPVFGTDVRISQDNAGRPHNEHFGAANPLNPLHFITGANDYATSNNSISGFYYTMDGGATWAGGNLAGPYPGGTGIIPGGDPAGDIDTLATTQNTYFADLGYNLSNNCIGGVYTHRSTDGGVTFASPVQAVANSQTDFMDKEWLAVNKDAAGTYAGRVYLTFTDFGGGSSCLSGTTATVKAMRSTDHGVTWSAPVTLSQPQPYASTGTSVAASTGGVVYAAYNYWTSPTANDQFNYITRSTDGGVTWGAYHASTSAHLPFTGYFDASGYQYMKADDSGHGFRHNQFPAIAASQTNTNTVYMVWTHHDPTWNGTYQAACCGGGGTQHTFLVGDIAFARSTDGGVTWSAPHRVNDDPLMNNKDHVFPAIAVSADGTIHVSWYDRRDDPNNNLYNEYYSQSTDGGATWSANQRVSDVSSNPAHVLFADNNAFIGDYSGIAANLARALPFWSDARANTPANEQREYTDPGLIPQATATSTTTPTNTPTITPSATKTATPGSPTATPTVCTINFSDVHTTDYFYNDVRCVYCLGAVSGYADGTFRPFNNTTRGQMTKIIVIALSIPIVTPTATASATPAPTFKDAPSNSPFYTWIETAAADNIVSGYDCGGPGEPCPGRYFRPNANVTRGQLSKIVVVAANQVFGWDIVNPTTPTFTDVPPGSPFYTYIETAVCHGVVSGYADHTFRPGNNAIRAQIAKIVCNVSQNPASTCPAPPTATATATSTPAAGVSIFNFGFNPQTVTVTVGSRVEWTNTGAANHTATSDSPLFDSGTLSTGQSYSFTFDTAGSYPYHCAIHPSMHGTVNVTAGLKPDLIK